MAEQILLNHNAANGITVKNKVSFLEHCMLNESPEMLRVFLENGANVDYLTDKERVWNLTLFRNHPGIFEVLKDYEIDLSREIRADYKETECQSQECQETLIRFLIMSSTSICMMPTAASYEPIPATTSRMTSGKEDQLSDSYTPSRKVRRRSSWHDLIGSGTSHDTGLSLTKIRPSSQSTTRTK
ncbi:hypothetical protein EG329_001559 [Mollisiaceae sp. DMI_Dod_QoI]|nr:hypothetical protein EG329_001559 [Helotiales sp. DMI_Dod_QoI]